MTTSVSGTGGITFPDSTTQNTGAFNGGLAFRNRIINGAMDFAQRGTSFSTPANGAYTLDRWLIQWGGAAPASVAQVAGPTGFRNAARVTGAASNTTCPLVQRIESYNCSDLSGATITIQANIAVSTAQNILWQLFYPSAQDNFASNTFISSGTWSATSTATTFTATITGLPSGATNGLQLIIAPNGGGAFTSGTITITGVQLEKSPTATSFDYRPYGTELILCQRYYVGNTGIVDTSFFNVNSTNLAGCARYPVTMRASPTVIIYNGSTANQVILIGGGTGTVSSTGGSPNNLGSIQGTGLTGVGGAQFGYSASAEL